jgi:hypothetical protein
MKKTALLLALMLGPAALSFAESLADEDLSKKLTNPLAAVISMQFKLDYDRKIGPEEKGTRYTFQFKPIVPFTVNDDWILVSRTNAFIVGQKDIFPGAGSQLGLTEIEESLFFTPVKPSASGWEWSVGPAINLPTASNDKLGSGKWSAGPTALILKQRQGFTYGALTKQVWSVAGDADRADVSKLDVQPFINYVSGNMTYGLFLDGVYDWKKEQWTLPINMAVSRLFTLGDTRLRLQGGLRYWAEGSEFDPKGWGARISFLFVFPKRNL